MGGFEDIYFAGDASLLHELFLERVGGTSVESNVYLACGYNPFDSREVHQNFLTNFATVYEGDPNEAATYSYDAVNIIVESLKAGATKDTLISTAKSLTFTNLICDDNVTFNELGDRSATGMDIVVVEDSAFAPFGSKVDMTGFE